LSEVEAIALEVEELAFLATTEDAVEGPPRLHGETGAGV
jgi:hypothetical protein